MLIYDETCDCYLYDSCEICHNEFDEIDYEYQMCHVCGWDAEKNTGKGVKISEQL